MLHFALLKAPKHSLNCAHKSLYPWWNAAVSSRRNKGNLSQGETPGVRTPTQQESRAIWKEPHSVLQAGESGEILIICYPFTTISGLKALVLNTGEFYLLTAYVISAFPRWGKAGLQRRKGPSKKRTEERNSRVKLEEVSNLEINGDINKG